MKGKPVDIEPNGDIVFEFETSSGKKRKAFPKTDPSVVASMRPKRIDSVEAATFPFIALILPLDVEFPDDQLS